MLDKRIPVTTLKVLDIVSPRERGGGRCSMYNVEACSVFSPIEE